MATNIVKFPKDLGENTEHNHFIVFRIYSNSSASLGGSNRPATISSRVTGSSKEDNLLRKLDGRSGLSEQTEVTHHQRARHDTGEMAMMKDFEQQRRDVEKWGREGDVDDKTMKEEMDALLKQQGEVLAGALKANFSDTTYSRAKGLNQDSIFLPFPQSINMSDGWNWEATSFQKSSVGEMMTGNFGESVEKFMTDAIGGVGTLTGSENVGKLIEHSKRRGSNPRKESMFNEPEMRTFSFEFDFAPRDFQESQNLQSIIQLFKYHASPELFNGDNALYNYPSEFQIYFCSGGEENKYIGRVDRCALQKISVNYTGANMWSAFAGDADGNGKGAPTHVKINLELTELSLQSRNSLRVMDGEKKTNEAGKE